MNEEEFRAAIRAEFAKSRRLAKAVADAVPTGDVEAFLYAVDGLQFAIDGWRLAMLRIGRQERAPEPIQHAFLAIWIETKMMALSVGHRPTLAKALRVLLPPGEQVDRPLTLYRGAGYREHARRIYGFSWTRSIDIAKQFASHWNGEDGSVVLRATVPPAAILHARAKSDHYDEDEVIVDPYKIGRISLVD